MSCAAVRARLFDMPSHALCVCEGCAPRGGRGKAAVKRLTSRTLRRSQRREIAEALAASSPEGDDLADARARREAREEAALAAFERYEAFLLRED